MRQIQISEPSNWPVVGWPVLNISGPSIHIKRKNFCKNKKLSGCYLTIYDNPPTSCVVFLDFKKPGSPKKNIWGCEICQILFVGPWLVRVTGTAIPGTEWYVMCMLGFAGNSKAFKHIKTYHITIYFTCCIYYIYRYHVQPSVLVVFKTIFHGFGVQEYSV